MSYEFNLLVSNFNLLDSNFNLLGSNFNLLGSNFNFLGSIFNFLGSNFNLLDSIFNLLGSNFNLLGSSFNLLGSNYSLFYTFLSTVTYKLTVSLLRNSLPLYFQSMVMSQRPPDNLVLGMSKLEEDSDIGISKSNCWFDGR